jgi:hypothetical protein
MQYYTVLCRAMPSYTILYYTILYYTLLYSTLLYYTPRGVHCEGGRWPTSVPENLRYNLLVFGIMHDINADFASDFLQFIIYVYYE